MTGWSLVILSLNLSLTAVTVLCWLGARRLLGGTSLKSLTLLNVEFSDLRSAFDGLREGFQRLNTRVGMREMRAKRAENLEAQPEVEESHSSSRESKLAQIRATARQRGLL